MCRNCKFKETKKMDSELMYCTLHDEDYKDYRQVIFCSAKEEIEK